MACSPPSQVPPSHPELNLHLRQHRFSSPRFRTQGQTRPREPQAPPLLLIIAPTGSQRKAHHPQATNHNRYPPPFHHSPSTSQNFNGRMSSSTNSRRSPHAPISSANSPSSRIQRWTTPTGRTCLRTNCAPEGYPSRASPSFTYFFFSFFFRESSLACADLGVHGCRRKLKSATRNHGSNAYVLAVFCACQDACRARFVISVVDDVSHPHGIPGQSIAVGLLHSCG